ncbi:class I tRNA ligase family protein, partial [Candidatus Micrarchaeota archaeon]|nr:class I tRNA ligase family protein [Candidatus Micrarchaeota archaeon]
SFHEAFKNYEINKGIKEIRSFLVNDLSRWYMKIAKDRISSGENKEAALWTIYTAMLKTIKMLGIITPMTAEYVYQNYYSKFEKEESLFMHELEKEDEIEIKTPLENKMGIVKEICSNGFTARQKAGIKTRWPIRNVYIETTSQEAKEGVNELSHIIKKQLNCKDVHVVDKKPEAGKIEECEFGLGKIHLDIHIDEELYEEGIANEIKRRIQNMRKQMKLVEKDMIEIKVGGEEEFMKIIEKYSSWLEKAVNAKSIKIEKNLPKGETYMIDGREITLEAKKI